MSRRKSTFICFTAPTRASTARAITSAACTAITTRESDEFALTYSQDARESDARTSCVRRALKAALGFDFIHTWRNRDEILRSDVIWTHTEHEYLVRRAAAAAERPQAGARRCCSRKACGCSTNGRTTACCGAGLYRKLMARADVLTTLASENANCASDTSDAMSTQVLLRPEHAATSR